MTQTKFAKLKNPWTGEKPAARTMTLIDPSALEICTDPLPAARAMPEGKYSAKFAALVGTQQPAPSAAAAITDTEAFQNFHRLLCARFGYVHDESDWRRDQLSLVEHIARQAQPSPAPQADSQPAPVLDMAVMQLAESVGLIGPASRVHDLHAAIQRFHDLICVNATIKAAVMAADAIRGAATSARDYPPLPMQFACSGVFPVYSADQMRAYVDADRAMRVAQPAGAQQPGAAYAALPESLILAVDRWFSANTGLGGCSDKDVRELAELFYGVTHAGGRESVDDALAIVESFGPGIDGLNDTYARQILLAGEVKRLRGQIPNAERTGELLMCLAVVRELTGTQQKGLDETIDAVRAAVNDQKYQPAQAVPAVNDDLRDRLVSISEAIAYQDDRAAQAMLREILAATQPTAQQAPAQAAPAAVAVPTFEDFCKRHGLDPKKMDGHGGMWARVALDECRATTQPAPQQEARPVTPYTCPKCHALWLHWPAEQSGFGMDTLNCRSTTHCDYCEKGGVEQLERLERVPAALKAPQQEAQEPVGYTHASWIAEAKRGGGGSFVGRKNAAFDVPIYTAPQPSPAVQGDALDAARLGWLNPSDMAALERVNECFEDGQGYDVPASQMKRMAELGVVRSLGFGRYDVTSFGRLILGSRHLRKPLETVEECNSRLSREHQAQLDAARAAQEDKSHDN